MKALSIPATPRPRRAGLIGFFLLAGLELAACGGGDKKPGPGGAAGPGGPGGPPQGPQAYPVVTAQPRSVTTYLEMPATVQGTQNVDIRPKVDGYVQTMYVDEGATVRRGQRLFRLRAPQYEQDVITAQAAIRTAVADVNIARMNVDKVRPLVEQEIISEYQLEAAQYALESKRAALAQAQATLAIARTNLGYTLITSPVDGVVGAIPYKIGSLITATTAEPLTTISSIGKVYAYFALNEKQLLSFTRLNGTSTLQESLAKLPNVQLVLADGTVYNHAGRVETNLGQINTETGSSNFRATFPNPQGLLRSGSSGTLRAPRTADSALVVPQQATYEQQGKRFLYVVRPDSAVRSVEVTVQPTPDGQSYVVQTGLRAGARVVTTGADELRDGEKIIPRAGNSIAPAQPGPPPTAGR